MKAEIFYSDGKLWGVSGGEIEFVSLRTKFKLAGDGKFKRVVIIRFTDHDVRATAPNPDLIKGEYYELEFRLSD